MHQIRLVAGLDGARAAFADVGDGGDGILASVLTTHGSSQDTSATDATAAVADEAATGGVFLHQLDQASESSRRDRLHVGPGGDPDVGDLHGVLEDDGRGPLIVSIVARAVARVVARVAPVELNGEGGDGRLNARDIQYLPASVLDNHSINRDGVVLGEEGPVLSGLHSATLFEVGQVDDEGDIPFPSDLEKTRESMVGRGLGSDHLTLVREFDDVSADVAILMQILEIINGRNVRPAVENGVALGEGNGKPLVGVSGEGLELGLGESDGRERESDGRERKSSHGYGVQNHSQVSTKFQFFYRHLTPSISTQVCKVLLC